MKSRYLYCASCKVWKQPLAGGRCPTCDATMQNVRVDRLRRDPREQRPVANRETRPE